MGWRDKQDAKRRYDVEMIKDFVEHLTWELRIATYELKQSVKSDSVQQGAPNPELIENLMRCQQKRQTVGLLASTSIEDDIGGEEGKEIARQMCASRLRDREAALQAIESLSELLEHEVFPCAESPESLLTIVAKTSDGKKWLEEDGDEASWK